MSALAYDVTITGKRGAKSTVTLWANSADQAARRVMRSKKISDARLIHVSDRNKKV